MDNWIIGDSTPASLDAFIVRSCQFKLILTQETISYSAGFAADMSINVWLSSLTKVGSALPSSAPFPAHVDQDHSIKRLTRAVIKRHNVENVARGTRTRGNPNGELKRS